jgi:glycosyltransferase involved in cell wall biosynthesis
MANTLSGAGAPAQATGSGEVLAGAAAEVPADSEGSCFLTVVMRTQGRRLPCLAEALESLAEQVDRDFEVLVVRHRTDLGLASAVQEVVDTLPSWLRERVRVLDVERPGRSSPLNEGFAAARGRYVAILDDDDLALPNWVGTFASLAAGHTGKVLRTLAVRQPVRAETGPNGVMAVPEGPPDRIWPTTFSFIDHLLVNSTPPVAVAFPVEVFRAAGERFDETLDTVEDWDFLMRTVGLVGIACSPDETCVYRWWLGDEGSRSEHPEAEWKHNEDAVRRKLDDRELLLPRGSVGRLKELVDGLTAERDRLLAERDREAANAQQLLGEAQDYLARLEKAEQELGKRVRQVRKLRARIASDEGEPSEPAPKTGRWGKPPG